MNEKTPDEFWTMPIDEFIQKLTDPAVTIKQLETMLMTAIHNSPDENTKRVLMLLTLYLLEPDLGVARLAAGFRGEEPTPSIGRDVNLTHKIRHRLFDRR